MLTIAELARRNDLPESTARYYCKRFRRFMPHVGEGKRRRYLEESLPVFEFILAEMADSKNATAVEAKLEQHFPTVGTGAGDAPGTHVVRRQPEHNFLPFQDRKDFEAMFKRQTEALEQIATALQNLAQPQHGAEKSVNIMDNEPVLERMQELEKGITFMRDELGSLRSMQDQAETIHQQDLEQLRKWLSHLAKEQNKEST